MTRQIGDIDSLNIDGERELGGQKATEFFVAVGLCAAQLMVEVRGARQLKRLAAGKIVHHAQERDRIGSSRQCHEHTITRLNQLMPPESAPDDLNQ